MKVCAEPSVTVAQFAEWCSAGIDETQKTIWVSKWPCLLFWRSLDAELCCEGSAKKRHEW